MFKENTYFNMSNIIDSIQVSGTVYTIGQETTTAVTSASTDNEIPTAKAVYDALPTGGTSITIDPTLDSGSSNPVANSAITNGINSRILNIYKSDRNWAGQGITSIDKSFNNSSSTAAIFVASINQKPILGSSDYNSPQKFSLVETSAITTSITSGSTDSQVPSAKAVYDALGGGGGAEVVELTQAEYDALVTGGTVDPNKFYVITDGDFFDPSLYITGSVTTAITSSSTNAQIPTAKAVHDAIPTSTTAVTNGSTDVVTSGGVYNQLGGLKLVKITQSAYDSLQTKDANTLYIING